jgi:protoporphyrinogen IX oxidase
MWYDWIKAFHIIAVIAWMAGMLYLPRLFVYHCAAEVGSKQSDTFKLMEHRLLKVIINPAMAVTWILGLWLAWSGTWYASAWLQVKIALFLVLAGLHSFLVRCLRAFDRDQNRHSAGVFRLINGTTTALMIAIVILVAVKPF